MAKVKYYAKENSSIGTHSFYAETAGGYRWKFKEQ